MAPQFLLEELGLAYELIDVNTKAGDQQSASYLALNPMAQVPALGLPDGTLLTETAAMTLYLSDLHPQANLAPPPPHPQRATFLRWLMFMAVNSYGAELRWAYPERYTTDASQINATAAAGRRDAGRYFRLIDSAIEGPYFLGDTYSALDSYLMMLVKWNFEGPSLCVNCSAIDALCDLVLQRPAIAKVWAQHAA
ncbi:MAG: glutathione S-transferase family protein [Chromatiales bacterium]|nr:glutathione S-transferase family protein [Chromatiales bacterium]